MKKRLLAAALLLLCVTLSGCASVALPFQNATATLVPGTNPALPEAEAPASLNSRETATLYFRYLNEPYLAPENRMITHSPNRPFELALLTELLSGPGTRSAELTALFPEGTRALSTVLQGRTLFVTLSREIMNAYPDEPTTWQSDPAWREEVRMRRTLCMQSLVATITENCDVDRVQVLVEQDASGTGSVRLQARYFMEDPQSTELAGPIFREESLLLTPATAIDVMLTLWQSRDWQRLYQYIALRDPVTGLDRVNYRDFVTAMVNQPILTDFSLSGGSVNRQGTQATYTLTATLMDHGGTQRQAEKRILRLWRENDLWRITLSQLTGWLEE